MGAEAGRSKILGLSERACKTTSVIKKIEVDKAGRYTNHRKRLKKKAKIKEKWQNSSNSRDF